MKFRAGDFEFTATVADSSESRSPRSGDLLRSLTIRFRAQKAGMHEAAVAEALQRQSGGLYSLGDSDQPEAEWRVRESNWTYVGSEPWGINHHVWRLEQVERLACELLRLGDIELHPYEYAEEVLEDHTLRLAARALATEDELVSISRISQPIEVVRVGISNTPRRMRLSAYVWGERPESLAVVLACEDVREPRVTLGGFSGSAPAEADLEDLLALASVDSEELRRRRHLRRRVANVDAWHL